jgi:hypothetical protein
MSGHQDGYAATVFEPRHAVVNMGLRLQSVSCAGREFPRFKPTARSVGDGGQSAQVARVSSGRPGDDGIERRDAEPGDRPRRSAEHRSAVASGIVLLAHSRSTSTSAITVR